MPEFSDLEKIRQALVSAVALVDRLADRRYQPIDQAIMALLDDHPDGLSTISIRSLLRRRSADVLSALRLLAGANKIYRNGRGRWVLADDVQPATPGGDDGRHQA
jgi:hypothetical protein